MLAWPVSPWQAAHRPNRVGLTGAWAKLGKAASESAAIRKMRIGNTWVQRSPILAVHPKPPARQRLEWASRHHVEPAAVPTTLPQSNLPGLELVHRGKVRDVYALSVVRQLTAAT